MLETRLHLSSNLLDVTSTTRSWTAESQTVGHVTGIIRSIFGEYLVSVVYFSSLLLCPISIYEPRGYRIFHADFPARKIMNRPYRPAPVVTVALDLLYLGYFDNHLSWRSTRRRNPPASSGLINNLSLPQSRLASVPLHISRPREGLDRPTTRQSKGRTSCQSEN